MSASDLQDIYSRTILDRARHPRHQRRLEPFDAEARAVNPLCGDRVTLRLRCAAAGPIAAIGYEARACAICMAAADLMAELVPGMTAEAARGLGADFVAALRGADLAPAWSGRLEPLGLFAPLRDAPSRIGCATLPWYALGEVLTKVRARGEQGHDHE
jgi:nitrogen fixation NifU-like protein